MYFVLRPFLLRGMKWTKVMRTKFTLTGWTCCSSYSPGNDRGNLGLPKLSARTCFSVCKAAALADTNTWDRNKDSTVDLTGKQKDCLSLSMGHHHGTESWLWLLTWHCWGLFSKLQWQTWPFYVTVFSSEEATPWDIKSAHLLSAGKWNTVKNKIWH